VPTLFFTLFALDEAVLSEIFGPSHQVVSASGEEVFFKIKRTTKLSKLQGAYANKVGKDVSSIRLVIADVLISFASGRFRLFVRATQPAAR
jgi:hypothetical protein